MIYFIQQGQAGPIKIGYASNPRKRLAQLKTANPEPLCLLGVLRGDRNREQELHHQFSDFRMEGEWFKPGDSLLTFIRLHTSSLPSVPRRRNRFRSLPATESPFKIRDGSNDLTLESASFSRFVEMMRAINDPQIAVALVLADTIGELMDGLGDKAQWLSHAICMGLRKGLFGANADAHESIKDGIELEVRLPTDQEGK